MNQQKFLPADEVDPFIGTDGEGNCLPGPYLPLSIVRLSPDTLQPQPTSGYKATRPIIGFSHTHVSGTGGTSRYGNIAVMPFLGEVRLQVAPEDRAPGSETASVGYYRVVFAGSGIECELTSTPRAGFHRNRFPSGPANIRIDAGSVIQTTVDVWATSTGGFVEWITEREVVGRADCKGGWGHLFPYSVYFYARFDRTPTLRRVGNAAGMRGGVAADGPQSQAVAHFGEGGEITLVVGISYVSVAKARASAEREIGAAGFEEIRARAVSTWNASLDRIKIEGGSAEQRTLFYTLFTRLLCLPSDLGTDDEFSGWHSGVRHFTDYYCLWDSVRNANSLISLFDPVLEAAMLNCLLDVADKIGWLPDAWIAGHSAMIQGGSSVDILFCEAAAKGIEGIDYAKALRHMRKNAEIESPDPFLYGRYLKDYRDLGYVSTNVRKYCVSRHLEYAYQDWCIGRLAAHLGDEATAARFQTDSGKIWNLWRDDLKAFAPRQPDGSWFSPFDPASCLPDSWNDPFFYEGTSLQWSFSVQHDFPGLVERHGGAERFVAHLDRLFDSGKVHAKETMLHVPYLYHYAGRPDLVHRRVREWMTRYFQPTRNGLVDNEDMGCQSAFYMCSALGIYPLMGQDIYWLTTPVFERSEIALGTTGHSLVIEAPGASQHPEQAAARVTLNGGPVTDWMIRHHQIAKGGVLRFEFE